MEAPTESLAPVVPALPAPSRSMLAAVTDIIPKPIYNRVTGWFGGERNLGLILAATAATVGVVKVVLYVKKQNRRKKWNAVGRDVVVLHTTDRAKPVPCLSPFGLKLETYLKLADIKYEVDFDEPMGPKGKIPWITLNGESIGDSQLIMEKLGEKFGKNLEAHLSPEQKGIARAMRIMVEDHFLWCFEVWIFFLEGKEHFPKVLNLPLAARLMIALFWPMIQRKMKKILHIVGMGRHSLQEIEDIGRKDLAAVSAWLGTKKFFMGDKPTEVDCAMFGFLAQFVYSFPTTLYGKMLTRDYGNLVEFCHRMKETVWSDWNSHLDKPHQFAIM